MKNVLIVAYYFPPTAASGTLRPLGFCRHLERYGWRAHVLTTNPGSVYPPQGTDERLCALIPGTVEIHRVPHMNPLRFLLAARARLRKAVQGVLPNRLPQEPEKPGISGPAQGSDDGRLTAFKNFVLDGLFSFPDPHRFWFGRAVAHGSRRSSKDYPDAVLATGGPWTSLLVGKALAQRFGVPFVADFRDPWVANPFEKFSSSILTRRAAALEREICHAATRVITTTEELRDTLLAQYPELGGRCVTITNGFDRLGDDAAGSSSERRAADPSGRGDSQGLELAHFGAVYGQRNPVALLQAVAELADERRIDPARLRVRFVGSWDETSETCELLARRLEVEGFVIRQAPISRELCLRQMARTGILLVLQPDFPLQIPTKIYDYVATGRPILVIGGEGATARLIERYQLGRRCSNAVADVKKLLWQLISQESKIDPPEAAAIARFEYGALAGELSDVLSRALAEAQARHDGAVV